MAVVSDSRIFPDLYNTGADESKITTTITEDWADGKRWKTIDNIGINMRGSGDSKYFQIRLDSAANGDVIQIKNTNLLYAKDGTRIKNIGFSANNALDPANSSRTKDVTIIYKNCLLPAINPLYGSIANTGNPLERIKIRLYDCTVVGMSSCHNFYAIRSQFISGGSDCTRAMRNFELVDCYLYNSTAIPAKQGDHVDILQLTPMKGYDGESCIIDNCNMVEPALPTAYLSGVFMGDLDYANYRGLNIKSLYANGGAYAIYLHGGYNSTSKWKLLGNVEKIEIGYNQQYGVSDNSVKVYSNSTFDVTGGENIKACTHPYIGTVQKTSDKIRLSVTNYLDKACDLRIITDSGTYTRSVDAFPRYTVTRAAENGYTWERLPINKFVEVPLNASDTYVQAYYGDTLIRSQVLSEIGNTNIEVLPPESEIPGTPPKDNLENSEEKIFPDLYNTGADKSKIVNVIKSWTVGSTILQFDNGVKLVARENTTSDKTVKSLDVRLDSCANTGNIVTIENWNLLDTPSGKISYIRPYHATGISTANDNKTKELTIIFRNCILPGTSSMFASPMVLNPEELIRYEFYDCTICGTTTGFDIYAKRTQFMATNSDASRAIRAYEAHDCYFYNDYKSDNYTGHIDILQTISAFGYPGTKLILDNCNMIEPALPSASMSSVFMGELDYEDYDGVIFRDVYMNGGGYIALQLVGCADKAGLDHRISGTIENIELGYNQKSIINGEMKILYNSNWASFSGLDNIHPVVHPYVGTVKKENNVLKLCVTNYLDKACDIRIVTNSGTYTRSIEAFPGYDITSNASNGYTWERLPINKFVEVPLNASDTYVQAYYGDTLIRSQVLSEIGNIPDIPSSDTDKYVISKSKIVAIADGFRSARGLTKKLSLDEMAVLASVRMNSSST